MCFGFQREHVYILIIILRATPITNDISYLIICGKSDGMLCNTRPRTRLAYEEHCGMYRDYHYKKNTSKLMGMAFLYWNDGIVITTTPGDEAGILRDN